RFALSVGLECLRRDPRVRMLFVGTLSPAVSEFQRLIEKENFAGLIRFVGLRYDIERYMLGSDILIFPSCGEGLGMVAVEAQASGLPVLASTAVPRECVIVPNLVDFADLSK